MPIYEYRCSQCDTRFEARRPADQHDAPAPACPNGHDAARRVLSVFATAARDADRSSAAVGAVGAGGGCGPGCACAANA